MRHLIAAALLTAALGAGATLPAAAQTTEWRVGSNLLLVAPRLCQVEVSRAYLQGSGSNAYIHLVFWNRSSATTTVSVSMELNTTNQSKSGNFGPYRLAVAAHSDQRTLSPFGGSLDGSRLVVNLLTCAATS